jgi:hypothetical protein
MSAIANEIVRRSDSGAPPAAIKPPRLNFARICQYCDERDCGSPECVALHERSRWMVCPECGGLGWRDMEVCWCMFGVIEACPAPADADRLAV